MVILGVLLLLLGAGLILAALFTAEVTAAGNLELLGVGIGAPALFLLGVGAAAAVLVGWWILKYGVKREWRQRKEQKHYEELSEKLGDADRNREREIDQNDPDRRPYS
jgi:hypothetical protein